MTGSKTPAELDLLLAKVNLHLAKRWSHTSPSAKAARIEECHDDLNRALDKILQEKQANERQG